MTSVGSSKKNELDIVIVLCLVVVQSGNMVKSDRIHGSANGLLLGINEGNFEISPSLVFASAAMLEGCIFVNAAPQNTNCEGLIELAQKHGGIHLWK